MGINLDIDKRIDSLYAPSYLKWIILPFVIFTVLGYLVGLKFALDDYKKGGYFYDKYDETCSQKIKNNCRHESEPDKCYKSKIHSCPSTKEQTSKFVPLLVYGIVPIIIASILAFGVYKLVLYINNPKLAAGVIIYRTLFR